MPELAHFKWMSGTILVVQRRLRAVKADLPAVNGSAVATRVLSLTEVRPNRYPARVQGRCPQVPTHRMNAGSRRPGMDARQWLGGSAITLAIGVFAEPPIWLAGCWQGAPSTGVPYA
jgi:hypothetical protein